MPLLTRAAPETQGQKLAARLPFTALCRDDAKKTAGRHISLR